MIGSIAALLLLQLAGTFLVRLSGVPLPGPVVGMLLLFMFLLWRGSIPVVFEQTTQTLLKNLALLFVPAGVGIVAHLHAVSDQWVALAVTLVASAAITLVVTAASLHWLLAWRHSDPPEEESA